MTPDKDSGFQFWDTVYISEVNGARKVKSEAQVAINKNSDPVQKIVSSGVAGEGSTTNSNFSKFLQMSKTSRARKIIFGLHVNIDKGNSRRYDVTR